LEHVSKISLTYPEIPIVLLLPEPIQPSLNWGPKVFALVKPISAFSILERLQFLNNTEFPYDGLLKGGMLLSLLDHCLSENKSFRISINYNDVHTADLLIRDGQWVSMYLDDGLRNDKLLLPFCWDNALYKIEETSKAEVGEFEITPADYQKFRMELHSWLSLMEQLPDSLAPVRCNKKNLKNYNSNLPSKVKPLIKLLDGERDLFRVFLDCELRPFETAQHLGYLFYSKIMEVSDPSAPAFIPENIPIPSVGRNSEPGDIPVEEPKRRSKELAAWIMDPLNAARKLEEKLKKDIKESRRQEPDEKQFRPRRRTQPGLGKLIGLLSGAADTETIEDHGAWNNVSTSERLESHEFAKSFVMTLGGDAELESEDEQSVPLPIHQEITKKVTPGNDQHEQSGSFKVSFSSDGEIEDVKRVATQEMEVFSGSEVFDLADIPAIILDGEGHDVVLEQDFENQALQSGVIEFDFKDKVAKTSQQESEDEEDQPVARSSVHVDHESPSRGDALDSSPPIPIEKSDIINEIKQIPKIDKEENRLAREPLSVDPERVSVSQDALSTLRKKRLKSGTVNDDEDSEERLSDKYQNMLDNISKSDPQMDSPYDVEEQEQSVAAPAYESFDQKSDTFFDYEEPSHTHDDLETFTTIDYRKRGKGKYILLVVVVAAVFAVWFFKFRGSDTAGQGDSDLKKNMAQAMTPPPMVVLPMKVVKAPMVVKAPPVMKVAPKPKTDPALEQKKKLRTEVEALFAQHSKKRSRVIYNQIKKLILASPVKEPRAMELAALIAFDYEGELVFAENTAKEALAIDNTRAEAWWVLGLLAYERGNKSNRNTAFAHYFKLVPNNKKRRQLAERMGFKP
ncbi:hypothetical protein KKF84_05480, partial [Myxococcota bacterium]|nr:hypothetical protein [Myxococcota bacterium]